MDNGSLSTMLPPTSPKPMRMVGQAVIDADCSKSGLSSAFNEPTAQERVEMGLNLATKYTRTEDSELRVLIFTAAYFVLDGVSLTIRRLEGHLRARGVTVKILSTAPDNLSPEQLKDVIIVPGIKIPFNHAGDYSFGIGLDQGTIDQIDAYAPNCIHFTVPDFVALDGIRYCQRNNIAYIGTWHSNYVEYLKYYFIEWVLGPGFHRYLKGFFEQIPTVYVPTTYMLRKMRDQWGYGTATELKLWGRGVDMQTFSPERRSERFRHSKGISPEDVVLLWVGRIVPEKRPDIWMGVVKRLQDEGFPVRALVVGSGTFERTMSSLQHVSCCGWLSGNALGEAYASADVLLFPSDVETFGNVTLEALSSGCPAVVERKCGEHLVDHEVNGMTCTCGDAEEFYQSTKKLVVDKALRLRMGRAAREKAWKFERNIILQEMAENYKDAIDKHRDPTFLKRHLQNPEGAGRNLLSVFCCNYYFVKMVAEPFLNTSRGVQDLADCSSECISTSRSRMSCGDLLSSYTAVTSLKPTAAEKEAFAAAAAAAEDAAANGSSGLIGDAAAAGVGGDIEDNSWAGKYLGKQKKGGWQRYGSISARLSALTKFICCCFSGSSSGGCSRCVHRTVVFLSMVLILVFIYAAFTV